MMNHTHELQADGPILGNVVNFDLLPTEIQVLIIESLGSRFFCQNVGRLTVSKSWHRWALRAMYHDMTFSRALRQLTPTSDSSNRLVLGCTEQTTGNLKKHLQIVRLHLDQMLRDYQFLPEDADATQDERKFLLMKRREFMDAPTVSNLKKNKTSSFPLEPKTPQTVLIMCCNLMYRVHASSNLHTLEIKTREAWGFSRSQVSAFEAVLCDSLAKKKFRHLYLDLSGLGRRHELHNRRAHQGDADLHDPLPLKHFIRADETDNRAKVSDIMKLWNDGHACSGIMRALPHLETLHYRSRCICPGIFRSRFHEDVEHWHERWPSHQGWPAALQPQDLTEAEDETEEPLHKLKEVIINMVLPQETLKHERVVHCMTFDAKLTKEAERHYADFAVKEMKREMTLFVMRLGNPRMVRLRYSRMRGGEVDRQCIEEFDALTGKTRQRTIDRWGDVTDSET